MNKTQWFVFSIGFFLLSWYLGIFSPNCFTTILTSEELLICTIKRYAFDVPSQILGGLGLIFLICGILEKNKK